MGPRGEMMVNDDLNIFHNVIKNAWNQVRIDHAKYEETDRRKIDSEHDVKAVMFWYLRNAIETLEKIGYLTKNQYCPFIEAGFSEFEDVRFNEIRGKHTDLEIFNYITDPKGGKPYIDFEIKRKAISIDHNDYNYLNDIEKLNVLTKFDEEKRVYLCYITTSDITDVKDEIKNSIENNNFFNGSKEKIHLAYGDFNSDDIEKWCVVPLFE